LAFVASYIPHTNVTTKRNLADHLNNLSEFSLNPNTEGSIIDLKNIPRGYSGELLNVKYRAKNYKITSGMKGIEIH